MFNFIKSFIIMFLYLGGIIFLLLISAAIGKELGFNNDFIIIIIAVVILFVSIIIYKIIIEIIYRFFRFLDSFKPCKHGVKGALLKIELCSECLDEHNLRIAKYEEERKQKELEYKRQEKAKYDEWVSKIQLNESLLNLDPLKFEALVSYLFTQMGYRTELTSTTGDHGIDIFLYKDDQKIAVQCKRVKNTVGEPILRDLYGAMHDTKSNSAIIVTTGRVSGKAREWIQGKNIRIIEMLELRELITKYISNNECSILENKQKIETINICPKCGNRLSLKDGKYGSFYGCNSYPACRFTRTVSKHKQTVSSYKPWN